jgi:hypothetical protein
MMFTLERRLRNIILEKMKPSLCNRSRFHPSTDSMYVTILLIIAFATLLTLTNFIDINVKAQADDIIDTKLRRPTTTQVISEKYVAPTHSNFNSSTYEVQPITSKGLAEDKRLESLLTTSPSYTITNITITFETAILSSDYVPKSVNVFVANTSHAIIDGISYR